MIYLLDTNAFSDLMGEDQRVSAQLAALSGAHDVVTCTIVLGEILHGIIRLPQGRRRTNLEQKASEVSNAAPCHAVPPGAADHYASIKLFCRQSGVALDENDLWIAATAKALEAILVTRDQDFGRVTGLQVEDWRI